MKIKQILAILMAGIMFVVFLFVTKNSTDIYSAPIFQIMVFTFSVLLIARYTGNNMRVTLFLAAIIAILSVSDFVMNNYQMKFDSNPLLPTVFTSIGVGFIALYLDNTKLRQFLVTGILFILPGLNFATILYSTWIASALKYILGTVSNAWPWFLLILGFGSLVKANKLRKVISRAPRSYP